MTMSTVPLPPMSTCTTTCDGAHHATIVGRIERGKRLCPGEQEGVVDAARGRVDRT